MEKKKQKVYKESINTTIMDKKEVILKLLKKEGELSTSKIAYNISSNQYKTEEALVELLKGNKVKKRQAKKGVYWSLK